MTDPETEMYLIGVMSLMVVIITAIKDILGTLLGEMATLEGKKIDPLTFKEISPVLVHSMETSKREWVPTMKLPPNMFRKTKELTIATLKIRLNMRVV